jgi:hypothetical protein
MVIEKPHFTFIRIRHGIYTLHEMQYVFLLVAELRD